MLRLRCSRWKVRENAYVARSLTFRVTKRFSGCAVCRPPLGGGDRSQQSRGGGGGREQETETWGAFCHGASQREPSAVRAKCEIIYRAPTAKRSGRKHMSSQERGKRRRITRISRHVYILYSMYSLKRPKMNQKCLLDHAELWEHDLFSCGILSSRGIIIIWGKMNGSKVMK